MRTVVIGATGHIGTYLIPRLVRLGHEVIAVSRGQSAPYQGHPAWKRVKQVKIDRTRAEEEGTFGAQIAELNPDIVVDLICFTPESCRQLVDALEGRVHHFLHCGTVWVHGKSEVIPTVESAPRHPFGEYGINKAAIEKYLLEKARKDRFPATILHPGHISGPGWVPINPAGNLNLEVYERLASGETVVLPDRGTPTLHHVHADDVAQSFERAITHWSASVGESFHVVSPSAVSLYGFAREVAGWFGREAKLEYLPWDEWRKTVSEEDAQATWDHIEHSPCASIEKGRRLIGYEPRYSSFEAVREAVAWLIENGRIDAPPIGP